MATLVKMEGHNEVYIVVDGNHLHHIWSFTAVYPQTLADVQTLPKDHYLWDLPVTYHQIPGSLRG